MRMRIAVAVAALSVGYAGIASGMSSGGAISEPIPARQNLMKENGAAMKAAGAMAKGEQPFNEAEAAGAMGIIKANMEEFPDLFPPDSAEGDTRASPKIWEDMDGFKAAAAKTVADAEAAEQAASQGLDAFKAAVGAVGQNCQSCHETYRLPRS